ncbi:hypothetical protein QCA50_011160 [Cerrena zonata]|uniref:RlpA-like protein double-psi beta-barrel domain-containing protein n=1 Tax=Cerrena zonata TaxID=2478898 RepID=A0AAW0G2B1_9APHY
MLISRVLALSSVLVMLSLAKFGNAITTGTGQATFYAPGLGACGHVNTDQDFIVAVSRELFDTFPGATANPNANPVCNQPLTANFEGQTVTVTVVDRCEGCQINDIDLSPTAFQQLASLDAGRLSGVTWTIG